MADSTYNIRTGDYLFGIASREENRGLLADIMRADSSITSREEAIGRYAMILAAANNLTDMDKIYAGNTLTIPTPDVVNRVVAATTDTPDGANLVQVYREVEAAYRNGGKEAIQAALNAPAQQETTIEQPPEPTAAPADYSTSQALVNAAGSYYMAVAAYDEILETLPPEQRKMAAELLRDSTSLQANIAQQFPGREDIQQAAARIAASAEQTTTILTSDSSQLGAAQRPINGQDADAFLSMVRVGAVMDQVPGEVQGEISPDKARNAISFALATSPAGLNAQGIMAAAPDNTAIIAAMAATQAQEIGPASRQESTFRVDMQGERPSLSFTDIAEMPLNAPEQNFRRGNIDINVNATGAQGAVGQLGQLRSDVSTALTENGVANPTEKMVTQATAYILAVENGEDRRTDRIRDDRNINIPSETEVQAAVGVFASAMEGDRSRETKLTGREQEAALDDVQAALAGNATQRDADIQR